MRRIARLAFCLAFAGPATSALAVGGEVPVVRIDATSVQAKLRRLPDKARPGPLQFAVGVATDFTLAHGRWQVDGDQAVWALAVESPGALSLNFHLAGLRLPPGAALSLHAADGRRLHGPYTAAQIRDGELWTPIVPGERAELRIAAPTAAIGEVTLRVADSFHAYLDPFGVSPKNHDPGLGTSGSCNIDVACPQGDDWRDEIRSVVRVQIGGSGLCSGLLVSNFRQDHDPLVLTADHCEIGTDGASSVDGADSDPASVVFYFNLQTASCGGVAEDADITQTVSGSSFIADDVESDFTLLRMSSAPPPEYDVHFAGFDAAGDAPLSGVSIHHPSGDVKKITPFTEPATASAVQLSSARTVQSWRVFWAEGTTEPGSSGSGLWNQDRRVVGLLSGGAASCDNQGGEDHFGRLDRAWQASAASDGQLAAHLDPDGCGLKAVDGIDHDVNNTVPEPSDDDATVAEDSAGNVLEVLGNDRDADAGQTLRIAAVDTSGTSGSVSIAGDGLSLSYTPAPDFDRTDSFRYTLQDSAGSCFPATVTVTVSGTPDAPRAAADSASVAQNSSNNIIDVLANDSDPDSGDTLSISALGTPDQGGTVAISNNAVSYTPAADFTGTERFSYTISDSTGGTDTATVTVTVTGGGGGGGGGSLPPIVLGVLLLAALGRRRV